MAPAFTRAFSLYFRIMFNFEPFITSMVTPMIKKFLIVALLAFGFQLHAQTFTDIKARLTGVSGSACTWVDYDQDGDLDAFVSGEFYQKGKHFISTKLYRNDRLTAMTGTTISRKCFRRWSMFIGVLSTGPMKTSMERKICLLLVRMLPDVPYRSSI